MYRQVAVLYYTGHIVYAIAIHTKVEKTSSIKFHSHLIAVCLCSQFFQLSLGCSSLQSEVW